MAISISGKTAIVTGAGKGIGRGIAEIFAADGAKVLVVCRSEFDGNAVVEAIRAKGGIAAYFSGDVRVRAAAKEMVECAIKTFGHLDILCLNAGVYPTAMIEDMEESLWDNTLDTNLKSVYFALQAAIPVFKNQKTGRVLVTSSITGTRVGFPGMSAYSASKGGVNGFIKTAALELQPYNVTVNGVEPGMTLTEGASGLGEDYLRDVCNSIPAGRLGSVKDIANTFLFLASDEANYITGQTIVVDGGAILPESPEALKAMKASTTS